MIFPKFLSGTFLNANMIPNFKYVKEAVKLVKDIDKIFGEKLK